jgi:hypothetical protein
MTHRQTCRDINGAPRQAEGDLSCCANSFLDWLLSLLCPPLPCSPPAASAKGKGWHHHHHHGHGHWGGGYGFYAGGYGSGYGGCYVKRLIDTPYGLRYRVVNVCY